MAHELLRLKSKICNTPHLVDESTFESIVSYLDYRCSPEFKLVEDKDYSQNARYSYNEDMQVAVMDIEGPTTYKPVTMFGMDCGGFSYQNWKEDFAELAEKGVKTVALMLNSGGGEAFQCFDSARYVKALAAQNGIKLISFVDGMAASAAYAIASISDEIIMSNGSQVGSIGVLIRLINDSKALEKEGYERTFITFGGQKVPFDKDGSFREEFLEDLQYKVSVLGKEFVSFVSENRGMTEEAVLATQAKTFITDDAIKLGLADRSMTVEDFFDYLADQAQSNMKGDNSLFGTNKLFNKPSQKAEASQLEVEETMKLEELQAQLQSVQGELAASQEAFTALTQAHAKATEAQEELLVSLTEAKAQVAALEQDKVQAKTDARKASLSKFVPEATAAELTETFAALDDASFEKVLSSYELKHVQAASSEMFQEEGDQGAVAHVDEQASSEASLVERIKKATLQR